MILIFIILYAILMGFVFVGLRKLNKSIRHPKENSFTIIVCARNEELNINRCLHSLNNINYNENLFEVIIVDDRSTDRTNEIVLKYIHDKQNFKLLTIKGNTHVSPKKNAITQAIAKASYDIVLTIDADCEVSPTILNAYNEQYNNNLDVIAGPVVFFKEQGILQKLIALDFLSLITFSAGFIGNNWALICSGANFSYRKEAFQKVGGFTGIDHISTGDDDLLLQKFDINNLKISYNWNDSAIVKTLPPKSFTHFINQRKRWGSKGESYIRLKDRLIMYYIYILMSLFILNVCFFLGSIPQDVIVMILIKILIDLFVSIEPIIKFKQLNLLVFMPIYSIVHPLYVFVFGVIIKFSKPANWKS